MTRHGRFVIGPQEKAAILLSEEQHKPGVKVRMNRKTFRVEYIRPDGSLVPDFSWFLNKVIRNIEV